MGHCYNEFLYIIIESLGDMYGWETLLKSCLPAWTKTHKEESKRIKSDFKGAASSLGGLGVVLTQWWIWE